MINFASVQFKKQNVDKKSIQGKKGNLYISTSLIFLLIAFIAVFIFSSSGGDETKPQNEQIKNNSYSVKAVSIPEELEFAGEPVPLDNFDTRESLDKELLVNTYFHSQTFLLIKRANRYFPVIEPILKKYGIPDDIKYLSVIESNLENSVSPKKAVGFWQIMEGTAKDYGLEVNNEVDERYHIEKSTEVACKFFLESYNRYKNWTLAAASYNAGRKGVDRQIERQHIENYYDILLNEETARYVFRALAIKLIITNPLDYGFELSDSDKYPQIPTYEIKIDSAISDFGIFAKQLGTNYKILKFCNPWLREPFLTNKSGKTYYLKIPQEGYRSFKLISHKEEK